MGTELYLLKAWDYPALASGAHAPQTLHVQHVQHVPHALHVLYRSEAAASSQRPLRRAAPQAKKRKTMRMTPRGGSVISTTTRATMTRPWRRLRWGGPGGGGGRGWRAAGCAWCCGRGSPCTWPSGRWGGRWGGKGALVGGPLYMAFWWVGGWEIIGSTSGAIIMTFFTIMPAYVALLF